MKTDRYTIYVGLNDGDTKEQKFATEKLERILYNVCKNYHVSFSVSRLSGGYFHDNGQFVRENSLQITLIGGSQETTDEIAEDVCAFFNQETVLVIHDEVDSYLIRNTLKDIP
ncbi:MAG: hypothetical protein MJ092_04460 [Lachnospiraceae bacterium]|nr:hypothetical protein [Lachnospiraceae bacterium]